MINNVLPALYIRLRRRSKLTRRQFAVQLGIGRDTLRHYETGATRPAPEIESKMIELSGCSKIELAEMFCEILSKELDARIGIDQGCQGYRPGTPLAIAGLTRRQLEGELRASERRTLDNKMHDVRLLQVVWERHNADLDEYAAGLRESAAGRRAAGPFDSGATGAATVAEPVFHNAAAGRRPAITDEG